MLRHGAGMNNDGNRIGTSGAQASSLDALRRAMGGSPAQRTQSSEAATRQALAAPRGQRMLPADYPLDQLDAKAPRGTYLDLLI